MRSMLVAVVVTLASLVAVPALAAPGGADAPAKTQRAEGDKAGKHFPMPAAEFKAHVDKRMARARAHLEERIAKLTPAETKEARAKFDAVAVNVNAEVAKAVADGTVTREEAKAVRAATPTTASMRGTGRRALAGRSSARTPRSSLGTMRGVRGDPRTPSCVRAREALTASSPSSRRSTRRRSREPSGSAGRPPET